MMEIKGDGSVLENINLAPATVNEEVIQNIAVILESVQGSVPMMRGFGISGQNMARPLQVIKNLMVGNIYEQIEEYEPRAVISGVTFEEDHKTGKVIPTVILEGVDEENE